MHSPVVGAGIDVGADRLHVVMLDEALRVVGTEVLDPASLDSFEAMIASWPSAVAVAIDGPDGVSAAPFADDATLAPKWRSARGCEVALGQQRGIWVSFATPTQQERFDPWMRIAATLYPLLRRYAHVPLETYPHAIFRTLIGSRLAKKTCALGINQRVDALHKAGMVCDTLAMWSHDALDAAAAALVAAQFHRGVAEPVTCELDGTSIWLPQRSPVLPAAVADAAFAAIT